MKRRVAVLVSALAFIVFLLIVARWATLRKPATATQSSQREHSLKQGGDLATTPPASTPFDRKNGQQDEHSKAVAQAIQKTNVPIQFWGKVVDQDQKTIANVSVRYSYSTEHGTTTGGAWAKQQMHYGEVTTDNTGLFSVIGISGHILAIESLTKEGYMDTARGARVYNYYGDTPAGRFTPNVSSPILFVMTSNAAASSLISYGGSFGKTLRLPGDGTAVGWDIWKGQPDPKGEMQFAFKRDPAVLARVGQPATWSAKIRMIDGGIVEAPPSEAFFMAPENGYVAELDYPKTERKRGTPARSFYIKTGDGKYGRVEIDLYPDDEGPTVRCLVKVAINPSGSRNLEYHPNEVIK